MFALQVKLVISVIALAGIVSAAPPATCDVSLAERILSGIATGKAFCSSLIYPHGIPITTVTQTSTASSTCVTKTKKVVTPFVFTTDDSIFVYLPQPTSTAYGSTVFVTVSPSGAAKKRAPQTTNLTSSSSTTSTMTLSTPTSSSIPSTTSSSTAGSTSTPSLAAAGTAATPANRPGNTTPTALSTCADKTISSACFSLIPELTTTVTAAVNANEDKRPCTTEVTVTSYITERTITVTTTISGTPGVALVVTSPAATVTLDVPAECLGPYYEGGSIDPTEFSEVFPQYPDFPIDAVHCCLSCFSTSNCAASFYDPNSLQCERLMRVNTSATTGPPDASCPLGTGDFPFTNSGDAILRGPCA